MDDPHSGPCSCLCHAGPQYKVVHPDPCCEGWIDAQHLAELAAEEGAVPRGVRPREPLTRPGMGTPRISPVANIVNELAQKPENRQ